MTRLDYCNSVLAGLPPFRVRQIQSVGLLNCAARVVANLTRFSHISTYMRDTRHWLPVERRIEFKLLLMGRASITGSAPDYISELYLPVTGCPGRRRLRSASRGQFTVPRSGMSTRARCTFSFVGPSVWNILHSDRPICSLASLPVQQTFFARLKTHLYDKI
jgi:hypothetical protein